MTKRYELFGITKTLREWCAIYDREYELVRGRLRSKQHWDFYEALTTDKLDTPRVITVDGVSRTIRGWSDHSGINERTIRYRLAEGCDPEEAVTKKTTAQTITARGETRTVRGWADALNKHTATIYRRMNRDGMSPEAAVVVPFEKRKRS